MDRVDKSKNKKVHITEVREKDFTGIEVRTINEGYFGPSVLSRVPSKGPGTH